MKKLFYFFAIGAMALGFASCGDGNDPDNGGNGGNTGKFKINISNVTETSFDVEIVPANKNTYYIFGKMKSAQFLDRPKVYAATYIISGNYPDNLVSDKQTEKYINLNIATEYAVFACEVGEDYKIVGDVEYVLVKTGGQQPDQPGSEGSLPGKFSVSSTKRVYFSKGNLQCSKGITNPTLRFAEHQWDFVGDDEKGNVSYNGEKCNNNDYRDTRYNGWIDLFGWGTGDKPWTFSTDNANYTAFSEWGDNKISNGGNKTGLWRTLTKGDWEYLLYTRDNWRTLRGLGTVNEVIGLILLPDEWEMPAGVTPFNATSNNTYSGSDWTKMESNGAVFLPAAGNMERVVVDEIIYFATSSVGESGSYWSSSPSGVQACNLFFEPGVGSLSCDRLNLRSQHFSVRLVQDVKRQ